MTNNKQALRGLSRAFFDSDLIATRFMLFIGELSWFIMLLWSGNTFDRPTYSTMKRIANEEVWCILFGLSAFIQIYIIMFEKYDHTLSRVYYYFNAVLWTSSVLSIFYAVYPPPAAIGMEVAAMLASIWIVVRPLFENVIKQRINK